MPRFSVRPRAWIVLLLLSVWLSAATAAPLQPETRLTSADDAVASGLRLEEHRQWRDAIDHYKSALERWPQHEHLSWGLRRAQFQFSIDRRYDDSSFRERLLRLSRAEALDIFDDVLGKVQAHYVDPISVQSIVAHGTESLWLALANEKFLEQNAWGADSEQVRRLRQALRDRYWNKPAADRTAARRTISEVCELGASLLKLNEGAVVMEYVFGACNCLDDYSSVLTPTRYEDLFSNIDGQFVGIGIVIESEPGQGMLLVDVLPESPAAEAGLNPGERLVNIEGVDCRYLTTDEAANLLSGVAGTRVRLEVSADDQAPRSVACNRREVHVKSIPVATMVNSEYGVAYLRMTGFQKNTSAELDAALVSLQRQGMKSLIWDVRGNPGGLLKEAVSVLDRFIDDGVLVSTKGRTADQNETFQAYGPGTWHLPLVLLIDENSASASEIVAGAVRDHHRGKIIGRKSFGKWSVQSIYPARSAMGLRLTTAKFYSPNGHTLGKIGVAPDVVVATPDDGKRRRLTSRIDVEHDADVRAAIDVLCGRQVTAK